MSVLPPNLSAAVALESPPSAAAAGTSPAHQPTRPLPTRPGRPGRLVRPVRLTGAIRAARRVVDVVVVVGLAAGLVLAALAVGLPWRLEPSAYVVLTGSMRPAYAPGTLVLTRPVTPAEVRVGDVLTYQVTSGRATVVTHRVVDRAHDDRGWRYRLRGDANTTPDPGWVRPVQVRGRVWAGLPGAGEVFSLLQGASGQALRWSTAALLVAYAVRVLLRRDRRDRRA